MQPTSIAWTAGPDGSPGDSWNPVAGCTRAGPECYDADAGEVVCYAERQLRMAAQREDPPAYAHDRPWTADNAAEVVTTHRDRLDEPYEYGWPNGPGKVFVCSMSDLFHREVPTPFIEDVLAVCRNFPAAVWILLTKRPERMAALDDRVEWPPNCWLGTSVGSGPGGQYPDTTHRIDALGDVAGAPLRWLSCEPLIEPLGDVDLSGIEWVVAGGESRRGPNRREMDHAWAAALYEQCRAADVPFFYKQSSGPHAEYRPRLTVPTGDGYGATREIREFPPLPAVTRRARAARERDGGPGEVVA